MRRVHGACSGDARGTAPCAISGRLPWDSEGWFVISTARRMSVAARTAAAAVGRVAPDLTTTVSKAGDRYRGPLSEEGGTAGQATHHVDMVSPAAWARISTAIALCLVRLEQGWLVGRCELAVCRHVSQWPACRGCRCSAVARAVQGGHGCCYQGCHHDAGLRVWCRAGRPQQCESCRGTWPAHARASLSGVRSPL